MDIFPALTATGRKCKVGDGSITTKIKNEEKVGDWRLGGTQPVFILCLTPTVVNNFPYVYGTLKFITNFTEPSTGTYCTETNLKSPHGVFSLYLYQYFCHQCSDLASCLLLILTRILCAFSRIFKQSYAITEQNGFFFRLQSVHMKS